MCVQCLLSSKHTVTRFVNFVAVGSVGGVNLIQFVYYWTFFYIYKALQHEQPGNKQGTNLFREPLVEFLLGVKHQPLPHRTLLALGHQGCELVTLKQPWHFTIGQQCIHPLEEARIKHIRLIHDETYLLSLQPTYDLRKIFHYVKEQ